MNFAIDAQIDNESKTIVKRNTRSVVLGPNGVLYLNDMGINAENVDFSTERVITIRVRPAP